MRICCARVGARFDGVKVLSCFSASQVETIGNPVLLILVEVNHTLDRRDDNAETTRYPEQPSLNRSPVRSGISAAAIISTTLHRLNVR